MSQKSAKRCHGDPRPDHDATISGPGGPWELKLDLQGELSTKEQGDTARDLTRRWAYFEHADLRKSHCQCHWIWETHCDKQLAINMRDRAIELERDLRIRYLLPYCCQT